MIPSDIVPWDIRDTGTFDSSDDFGWGATDYSDCVEAGDVVDWRAGEGREDEGEEGEEEKR